MRNCRHTLDIERGFGGFIELYNTKSAGQEIYIQMLLLPAKSPVSKGIELNF